MIASASKQYGPYEIVDIAQGECQTLVTLPYSRVVGSHMLIRCTDNFGRIFGPGAISVDHWVAAEVVIAGYVQGSRFVITRQQIRNLSGPMRWIFAAEEMYESVEVAARNMTGGRRGSQNTDSPGGTDTSSAAGFSIKINVSIQPVQQRVIGAQTVGFGDDGS